MNTLKLMLAGLLLTVGAGTMAFSQDEGCKEDFGKVALEEFFAGAFPGFGHQHHGGGDDCCDQDGPPKMTGGCLMGMQELKLSKEQKDKIKTLRTEMKKKNIPLISDLKLKRLEMKELMDAEKPDKDKITAKIKEIESIRTKIHTNRALSHVEVLNTLTKEQREKLEQKRCCGKKDRPMKKMKKYHFYDR